MNLMSQGGTTSATGNWRWGATKVDQVDCVVIGAGVVGLACARALAQAGRDVVVLEAADRIGSETSSRNSEVIHAGIYYPLGSLKARACVAGRRRLYAYCAERGVPHRRCGKLIVAHDEDQAPKVTALVDRAHANGVETVRWLTAEAVRDLEPELRCVGAAFSPDTGIVDSHALMLALQADLETAGGVIAFKTRVVGGRVAPREGLVLRTTGVDGDTELLARQVVINAGLHVQSLLESLEGFPAAFIPKLSFAKGSYFAFTGRSPFQRLIYPAPEAGGLGVHVTLDMSGALRFGPDVEWVDRLDYDVDPARGDAFYSEVRKYWPSLPDGAIQPAYAGIRPKLSGPGEPASDFVIQTPADHGVTGLVNMLGIESPGLTSCLALADMARDGVLSRVSQIA
jgi:L-2-hydroxyglutarate oxidase LhgO